MRGYSNLKFSDMITIMNTHEQDLVGMCKSFGTLELAYLREHVEDIAKADVEAAVLASLPDIGHLDVSFDDAISSVAALKATPKVAACDDSLLRSVESVRLQLVSMRKGLGPLSQQIAQWTPFLKIVIQRCAYFLVVEVNTAPVSSHNMFPMKKQIYGKEAMATLWKKHFAEGGQPLNEQALRDFRRYQFLLDTVQVAVVDDRCRAFVRDERAAVLAPVLCDGPVGEVGDSAIVLATKSHASSSSSSKASKFSAADEHAIVIPKGVETEAATQASTKKMLLAMFGS
jgi:hypothetical protein